LRDYGSEVFFLPGIREPVAHVLYILRKTRAKRSMVGHKIAVYSGVEAFR